MKLSTALGFLCLLVLSGCGMMDDISETKDAVKDTRNIITETRNIITETRNIISHTDREIVALHLDEKIGGAVTVFTDETKEEAARIRSLLIFFEFANMQDTVFHYLGTPRPIYSERFGPIYQYTNDKLAGTPFAYNFANVSYAYDRVLTHVVRLPDGAVVAEPVKMISPAFHELLQLAANDAVKLVVLFHSAGYKSDEERVANIERARRVVNIGTTIIGGRSLVKAADTDGDGLDDVEIQGRYIGSEVLAEAQKEKNYLVEKPFRVAYANSLVTLLGMLGLQEDLPVLATLVEKRLGLQQEEWNYPVVTP